MKAIVAPSHRSLVKSQLKYRKLNGKVKAAVQKLQVISQIVELRESLGLTQAELAARMGVSQPVIARIENDETANLSLETLIKIVDALHGEMKIKIRPLKKAA